jgi:hypothetical protein
MIPKYLPFWIESKHSTAAGISRRVLNAEVAIQSHRNLCGFCGGKTWRRDGLPPSTPVLNSLSFIIASTLRIHLSWRDGTVDPSDTAVTWDSGHIHTIK